MVGSMGIKSALAEYCAFLYLHLGCEDHCSVY